MSGIRRFSIGAIAQQTRLGWIISGIISETITNRNVRSFMVEVVPDDLSSELRRFWEMEEVTQQITPAIEDRLCEDLFQTTTTRRSDGRYIVHLPFKPNFQEQLGASRSIAVSSFLSLERHFEKDPAFKEAYIRCMTEYITLGHMVPTNDRTDVVYEEGKRHCVANYLPHHAVTKESSSTSLRVVFDASRKTSTGVSMNDALMTEPPIQSDLLDIIMRWRHFEFAFVADIEKMYRQIFVTPKDAQFQRIVFRQDSRDPLLDYIIMVVTFGVTCAPFLALRTLRQLSEEGKLEFPKAFPALKDDWLSGIHSVQEAVQKRKEVSALLRSAGFKLRKWISNEEAIIADVPPEDREMKPTMEIDFEAGYKTLGLIWLPYTDFFSYRIKLVSRGTIYTKRTLLSDIARLFDPLGFLAPVVVAGKIIMQSLWLGGSDWDEPVSIEINNAWTRIKDQLPQLETLRIPRWMRTNAHRENIELHGFYDASQRANAAVIYVVVNGNSIIVLAKTKVAPIKPVSIPRLELCAAALLSRAVKKVKAALDFQKVDTYLWSDSAIVLAWLRSHPSKWTVFVANRTAEIHDNLNNGKWQHVPTAENPADFASRGLEPQNLINNNMWWNGPDWIIKPKDAWPVQKDIDNTNLEIRRQKTLCFHTTEHTTYLDKWLKRYSSLSKLLPVTAYCFRFVAQLKKKPISNTYLDSMDFQLALNFWLRHVQRIYFQEELDALKANQALLRQSRLLNMNPFLDVEGLMRVGGRLQKADISYGQKHPIILPSNNHFSELVVTFYHLSTLHGGVQLTLSVIRSKYWIINGRNSVKHVIHRCITCFRHKAKTQTQLMGQLPSSRVVSSRPFLHTGVDYCGPFSVKTKKGRGSTVTKGYVALFICMTVKAIHLKLVGNMTTDSFLATFRRFVSRRGTCKHIYSDQGTNFVGADGELKRRFHRNQQVAENVASEGVIWHFNPPAPPTSVACGRQA